MLYGKLTGLFEVTVAGLSMALILFTWAERESGVKLALKAYSFCHLPSCPLIS